jgi:hypothetical protein
MRRFSNLSRILDEPPVGRSPGVARAEAGERTASCGAIVVDLHSGSDEVAEPAAGVRLSRQMIPELERNPEIGAHSNGTAEPGVGVAGHRPIPLPARGSS